MKFKYRVIWFFVLMLICLTFFNFINKSYVEYTAKKEALIGLNNNFIDKVKELTTVKGLNHLLPAEKLAKLTHELFDKGQHLSTQSTLLTLFTSYLALYPQFDSCYIGFDTGNFILVTHHDQGYVLKKIDFENQLTHYTVYDLNLRKVSAYSEENSYDPRKRQWYLDAVAHNGMAWSNVYMFFTNKIPGVTVSFPMTYKGVFKGVMGVDISILDIITFIRNESRSSQNVLFLLDQGDQVIATSYQHHEYDQVYEAGEELSVSGLNNPIVSEALDIYKKTGQLKFEQVIESKRFVTTLHPFVLSQDAVWTLMAVSKYDEVLELLLLKNEKKFIQSLIIISVLFGLGVLMVLYAIRVLRALFSI